MYSNLQYLILFSIVADLGVEPQIFLWEADSSTTALIQRKHIYSFCIYTFHAALPPYYWKEYTSLNPDLNRVPHRYKLDDLTTAPQRLKNKLYLPISKLYLAKLFSISNKKPANIAGSSPTFSSAPIATQLTEVLYIPATSLGVANQQICKLQTASSDLSIYEQ